MEEPLSTTESGRDPQIEEMALWLGIDPDMERELLWIAELVSRQDRLVNITLCSLSTPLSERLLSCRPSRRLCLSTGRNSLARLE